MFIRNPYNYSREQASIDTGLMCMDKSRAQQNQKEEADINTIVKRFGLTGQLPMAKRLPEYGDFTGINDYHTALNEVRKAEQSFMQLPAELRKRFDNDPAEFLEFVMDDKNREEAEKLGLVPKKEPAATGAVPATKVGGKKGQTTVDKIVESDAE
ncbi:MAG: internal scaffolding protein [Microviridae sp.]|nr:MAG: internal scaffolding protein [Microviridae sp.]